MIYVVTLFGFLSSSVTFPHKFAYCIVNHGRSLFLTVIIYLVLILKSGLLQPSDLSSLSAGRSIACPIRMSLYIFLLYHIYHLCFTCIDFYDLSAWGGCWFDVLYKEVYLQIFKCVSFWLHGCCGEWEGWPRKQVNHTSWVAVVTPTDRPKSVRNRCLIELFCGVVCVVTALLTFPWV